MPEVSEDDHDAWHSLFDKYAVSDAKMARLAADVSRNDPGLLRFFQAAWNPFPLSFCGAYFMLERAAGGSLPIIDDAVKARVVQDTRRQSDVLERIMNENPVLQDHIHHATVGSIMCMEQKKQADPAVWHFAAMEILQFEWAYEMIRHQLQGSPQPTLEQLAGPRVKLESFPKASDAHCDHLSKLIDQVGKGGDIGLVLGVMKKNDPELYRFFYGGLRMDGATLVVSYALLAHAAGGALPRISDEVKARVLQEYGPADSKERARLRVETMQQIIDADPLHARFIGNKCHRTANLFGKDALMKSFDQNVLLYRMLERQIEQDNESS